jgi:hypothetical protein
MAERRAHQPGLVTTKHDLSEPFVDALLKSKTRSRRRRGRKADQGK